MVSLCIAFLCGFIAAVSTLNLASQGSIAVASDIPTSSLNLLDLLSPSSQSVSWPNISFPPARPPFMATNVSALKALGLDTDTPVYWQTTPSGNTMAVQCHVRHGRRLDYQDCRDAYRYIPRSDARIARFAERHTRWPHDIALPQRNLGSKGKCAISPILVDPYDTATASARDVADAAYTLIERCAPRSGGIAVNIGGDNHLAVVLQPYVSTVRCEGSGIPFSRESCAAIERNIEADQSHRLFGNISVDPAVEELLPYDHVASDQKCALRIASTADTDIESFFHLWEETVALNAMCVRAGKRGTAMRLGLHQSMFLEISDHPFDPPVLGAINVTAVE